MLKKLKKHIIYILFSSFILIMFCPTISFGAYPKLIATIFNAFQTIQTWIIRIATPAAAVSVRHTVFL